MSSRKRCDRHIIQVYLQSHFVQSSCASLANESERLQMGWPLVCFRNNVQQRAGETLVRISHSYVWCEKKLLKVPPLFFAERVRAPGH